MVHRGKDPEASYPEEKAAEKRKKRKKQTEKTHSELYFQSR